MVILRSAVWAELAGLNQPNTNTTSTAQKHSSDFELMPWAVAFASRGLLFASLSTPGGADSESAGQNRLLQTGQ